ncbi:AAA family ATPase [Sulfurimonas sp. SAG-AH-194-C21]|nr:AAA family ATPase [Sulfurimonas sp. SAG-AH-194-C21]MDF1884107.1 AAA family ATPase [Sulfurimonas sp. SAG-AH-194-C21]
MTKEALKNLITNSKKHDNKFTFLKCGYVLSPFISKFISVNKHVYNSTYYEIHSLVSNPKVHFVTLISYYDDKYILKCGDPYLDGSLTQETVENLVKTTMSKLLQPHKTLVSKVQRSYNITPRSSSCTFNQKNYEIAAPLCEHISHFLAGVEDEVFDKLFRNYVQSMDGVETIDQTLALQFERYSFAKHIILEGDKGSGKTYAATTWCRENRLEQIFIGGHEQFESIDFLGHYIQQKNGELVWKDGALSEAFRKAKAGTKVVVIIDELLRIPKRELNLLISALSPINGKYVLRTGRAKDAQDGIAIEEVIQAPKENLWVMGTTNIGAAYAVETMDEALTDRFIPIRKDTTAHELRKILLKTVEMKRFSTEVVQQLMNFYEKMSRIKNTKIINKIVNIRHLCEAIEIANNQGQIQEILGDMKLLWVDREYDGKPDSQQLHAVERILENVYATKS